MPVAGSRKLDLPPPAMVAESAVAVLLRPPATVAKLPLAVLSRPPPTLASRPLAVLSPPPPTLAPVPLAVLRVPPPMVAMAPVAVLDRPPPTVAKFLSSVVPALSPGSGSCPLIVRSPPIHRTTFHQPYRRQNNAPQIRPATEKIKPHAERSNRRHNPQRTIKNQIRKTN